MITAEQVLSDVRRLTGEGDFKGLAAQLASYAELLLHMDCVPIVEGLDAQTHSLGVLAALHAKLTRLGMDIDWPFIMSHMKDFVEKFTPEQVREAPSTFCGLIHRFTEMLCLRRKTIDGIAIVRTAIRRYQPTPSSLTAMHADLIQLCLLGKCLKPALPFLERDYTVLLTDGGQFDVKYVLLFYYYGGMVHSCLHHYLKALLFFTVCLTTPTVAISAVMVAAHKKFVLVSLLKFGKVIPLPRYCSHVVERVIKPLCGPYTELVRSYCPGRVDAIQAVVTKYTDVFRNDGNAGLIQRLQVCILHHSVQRLTHTFMTLSLADVSSRVKLSGAKEAEEYVRNMIEEGEIDASLDQHGGMVCFTENPENLDSVLIAQRLDSQLTACMALESQLSSLDRELTLDPRYVHRMAGSGGAEEDPLFHDEAAML